MNSGKVIGALWIREYERDGQRRKMMAGEIDLGILGSVKIVIFKNDNKEKDSQPDYRIALSKANPDKPNNSFHGSSEDDIL